MEQATFIQYGDAIDHTPDADVAAGQVVALGELIGVAKTPIKTGEAGALAIRGVFDVAKNDTDELAVGDEVYWNDELKVAVPTGSLFLGRVVRAAVAGELVVRTLIVPLAVGGGVGSA